MKHFLEVLMIAAALLFFAFSQTALGIFAIMFFVVLFIAPSYKGKSVEEIIAEAKGEGSDAVYVKYSFVSEPNEEFTATLHHYSNEALTTDIVLAKLAEYVTEHTGIDVQPDRLHVVKFNAIHE